MLRYVMTLCFKKKITNHINFNLKFISDDLCWFAFGSRLFCLSLFRVSFLLPVPARNANVFGISCATRFFFSTKNQRQHFFSRFIQFIALMQALAFVF